MSTIAKRLKNAWSAFSGRDAPRRVIYKERGPSYASRPDRYIMRHTNIKSIVSAIYNQIAVDVSQVDIKHVKVDSDDKVSEIVKGNLQYLLQFEANSDQTGREVIQDIVISMFDEGVVALVPTVFDDEPKYDSEKYEVCDCRVGKIKEWYPRTGEVKVEVWNENAGRKEEIVMRKELVPIFNNPFYAKMNEPNSLVQRLIVVLNQLDRTNEQNSAGKIDLLVQLPYAVRSDIKKAKAEDRRKDLEEQLTGSQYGIGYIDASERVIQLNRAVENNLWSQAQDLLTQLYNQIGFSEKLLDGTADEQTMINYHNATLAPVLTTITEEIQRKWLSSTAIAQGHRIKFFRDPFKLLPVSQVAELSDKLTRNEIYSSNEIRSKLGSLPFKDKKADELRNSNLNHPDEDATIKENVDIKEPGNNTQQVSKLIDRLRNQET